MIIMWETIGFIASSKYRESIFLELNLNRRTPKELSELTNIAMPNVTRALKELETKGLVECINPDFKRGRMYGSTELGLQVFDIIEKQQRFRIFLGKRLENKIITILDKNRIIYYKYHELITPLLKIRVDFFLPKKNIVIFVHFLKDNITERLYKLGFESSEIKKSYREISVVLFLGGNKRGFEKWMKLKKQGYVDEVFIEGEEERFFEFIA